MDIDEVVAGLSGELEPLRDLASRLRADGDYSAAGGVAVSHRPHVAPESYALRLYLPLPAAALARYQEIHCIALPLHYVRVLEKLNGAHAFELSLFGVPPSMADDPPLLDRSRAQPYDVGTANQVWKSEYDVPREWFHFGGGPCRNGERIGYFFGGEGTIYSSSKSGERLGSWTSFHGFLSDELSRAEAAYPEHEAFMVDLRNKRRDPKPRWKKWFTR